MNGMGYIQNRTNWCWAVACKMLGDRYKKTHPEFTFSIDKQGYDRIGNVSPEELKNGVITKITDGLRREYVRKEGDMYLIDAWQRAIVMNANSIQRGIDGNFPGDDEAKLRGLNYVVTGKCESTLFRTVSAGCYNSQKNLLHDHGDDIISCFENKQYMIGNSVLYPGNICHSFVLLDWLPEDRIRVYDPWNGTTRAYTVEEIFCMGFCSALGYGMVKWVQCIE